MAAQAYGAERELVDIDLVIHESDFQKITDDVREYIKYGPSRYVDQKWDLTLMTLFYENQTIDISGAESTKYFDLKNNIWISAENYFENTNIKNIFGIDVSVVSLDFLIKEKEILNREVDLEDLKFLLKNKNTR